MGKGIAIGGSLIVDMIKYIESYPAPQTLTTITSASRSTGGLAANCALTLARLDPELPLSVIGLVGQDEAGDFVMSQFAMHPSIDASRVGRQGVTSYTDVMTEQTSGRRTFFQYRGANAHLSPEHFDIAGLAADILHVGYVLLLDRLDGPDPAYPTALCRVLDRAQRAGIRTSIDVVSEEGTRYAALVTPALRYVDYCIINEIEASRTTGIPLRGTADRLIEDNLPDACAALMSAGVGSWVVIHAPELSCGLSRDGALVRQPSWRLPPGFVKSTVGAGDAFASGVLYGAYHGWDLAASIDTAAAVAAFSLSGVGASDAIRVLPELLSQMRAYQDRSDQ